MSSTSLFHAKSIFGFENALSCMIFDPRSVSRRWMIVTFDANFVRNVASSSAESPPPTTAIGLSRKKNPSQVAHVDTPCPSSLRSDGKPSNRADAPVAMMSVDVYRVSSPHVDLDRAPAQFHLGHVAVDDLGAEPLGLRAHLGHQIRAHDAVAKAGEILHRGGEHQLPARLDAFDEQRLEVGARGIQRRRETGGAGPDDGDIPVFAHASSYACLSSSCLR